jgi:hypothetical protein
MEQVLELLQSMQDDMETNTKTMLANSQERLLATINANQERRTPSWKRQKPTEKRTEKKRKPTEKT